MRQQTPLLDVRAPTEFNSGALPCSTNLAILNDAERAAVGKAYKQSGRDAAMQLGYELVSGDSRAARIAAWLSFIDDNPDARIMCWRGGQRSRIAQAWLAEHGVHLNRIDGGYKALRQTCMAVLEDAPAADKPWWVVAGRTGVQKTVLIQQLANSIDLEHLAHHRGSAFGAFATPQPSQATFENHLACVYLRHQHPALVLEDESRTIGRIGVPAGWHARMQQAPLVLIETDLPQRVAHIVAEYVTAPLANGAFEAELASHYRAALERIKRRLGGVLYARIDRLVEQAFQGAAEHADWVHALMHDYYDPMYDYQLANKEARIVFRGSLTEAGDFLKAQ